MAKISNSIDMMNNDVCFQTEDNRRFRLRAAAIIIEDGCVLFATNDVEKYYYSIGGAIELGETAEQAVLREVFEETGVHYEIDRLAYIEENFFKRNDGAMKGLDCHEISFFFLMKSLICFDITLLYLSNLLHFVLQVLLLQMELVLLNLPQNLQL